jgi:hypothetical protein
MLLKNKDILGVGAYVIISLFFFCLLGYDDNLVHSNLFCFLTFVIFCSFTFYNQRLIIEMNKYFLDV